MYKVRLEGLREEANLKSKEIAKMLGVSPSIYSNWEKNKTPIPIRRVYKLANFYKVNIDYILGLNDKKVEIYSTKEIDAKEVGKRIKEIRKNNNLTLRSLASVLNTTSSTISAYETGKVLILTSFALEICKKYNVSLDWLCGRI